MANSRYYSSIAQQTTLTSGITASGTTMIVAATTGFPGSLPYILAVDYGAANEELVLVTGVAGTTLTVTRAYDNTSGSSHNPGAVIRHVAAAIDHTDSRTHEASASGVHGVTGSVVGTSDTQTLTNKTVTNLLGSARNFKIYASGAAQIALQIIGDSANTANNRVEILDDETSLNVMAYINSGGAIKSISRSTDADNTYRLRLTDNNGTTDRFATLAGGTMAVTPTSTTTFPAVDVIAPDLLDTKRAIRVAASGGGNERFTVWNDGRVDIVGSQPARSQFDIQAAASQSADTMRVQNNAGSSTWFAIQSNGKMLANVGATIAQPGVTSGAVLQVGGSNTGYTGNLTQWVSPANVIVGFVNQDGAANFSSSVTAGGALTANGLLVANAGASVTGTLTVSGVTTATGTSVATAAAGFSIDAATIAVVKGGWVTMNLVIPRTGATLTASSTGNLTDTSLATIAASYRPNAAFGSDRMIFTFGTGFTSGAVGLNPSTGLLELLDANSTSTIDNTQTVRVTLTYPL